MPRHPSAYEPNGRVWRKTPLSVNRGPPALAEPATSSAGRSSLRATSHAYPYVSLGQASRARSPTRGDRTHRGRGRGRGRESGRAAERQRDRERCRSPMRRRSPRRGRRSWWSVSGSRRPGAARLPRSSHYLRPCLCLCRCLAHAACIGQAVQREGEQGHAKADGQPVRLSLPPSLPPSLSRDRPCLSLSNALCPRPLRRQPWRLTQLLCHRQRARLAVRHLGQARRRQDDDGCGAALRSE